MEQDRRVTSLSGSNREPCRDREIVGNRGDCLIVKVRAMLKRRGGRMSGTRIGSRSKWRQVNILESFRVQESQEGLQDLHLAPDWEQSTLLFSGEMRKFLPACLGNLDWSSRGMSLLGHLVQSLVSGFVIHLRIGLSEVEGDAFLGALEVNRMEDRPVVKMEGDMEVVDAEFKCRD